MTNYLVTGGAGFIGSTLVHALVAEGHQVRLLDNFSTGRRANLSGLQGKVEIIDGDIRSYHQVWEAVQGVEYVLHQAALVSVPLSVKDPITTNDVNVTGTLHVLHAAKAAGVRRVVMASSSAVYGSGPELPKHEGLCPAPLSPYAISKLALEQYGQAYAELQELETVSLRYFNVYGPKQDLASPYAAVIPRFISALLAGKPLTLYGDGTQSRDFVYVEDVVQANLLACHCDGAAGKVFNVAAGRRYSLRELIVAIETLLGVDADVTYEPARKGDVLHSGASIARAQEGLGYVPRIDLAEGLAHTAAWYQALDERVQ
jgi:nucleoside-diphosphate-sugar epimerase